MAQSRSSKPLTENIRAPFAVGAGISNTPSTAGQIDNNFARKAYSATAGNPDVEVYRVGTDDSLIFGGGQLLMPALRPIFFRAVPNGAIATTRFHIFGVSGKIRKITEIHTTAGDDAGAVTAAITLSDDGQAPGDGTSVMSGTFNLKGTAVTEQTATLTNAAGVPFVSGQSLSFKLTGTPTTAAGVLVCVWVQYDKAVQEHSWYSAAVTATDQVFFLFNRPYAIQSVRYAHATKETTDTSANVQVVVDTSTNAPGAGTNLLTNNTNVGFDCNAANNVVQTGTFAATTPAAGDRLAVDFRDGSYTQLAGTCVTVTMAAQANRIEVPYWLYDGGNVDSCLFSADRDYELWDGRFVQSVAAGGVSTANIERESGTTAPGSGTALLNTAWDLNATVNTVVVADLITVKATLLIPSAYRLSLDFGHAEQSTAGVALTLSLMAR
jgi:hypothetical protein